MAQRKQASRPGLAKEAREVAQTCLGMNIRIAARRITRFLEARMQGIDLSVAQFGLMVHIAAAEDDTIGALAGRADLDPSTLSRNLRSLERMGLVEIAMVERDLRRRAVWLTEKGARRLAAALPVWRRAHETLSGVIGPRGIDAIEAISARLGSAQDATDNG
jgi:DNA-binding MarR family transcriptional regulator